MDSKSRFYCVFIAAFLFYGISQSSHVDDDFAEFAEFDEEEFDDGQPADTVPVADDDIAVKPETPDVVDDDFDDEGTVAVEDGFDEFDSEEFDAEAPATPAPGSPELKIAKVPVSFRRDWSSYYVEIMLVLGMFVYFIAFLLGRTKNSSLAQAWYKANKDILCNNFAVVGDDGTSTEPTSGVLMKESDHSYVMWCSGRIGVEGMLVQLKMVKRQDLVNFMQRIVKPATDQIVIEVTMEKEDMDSFIFCFAQKRSAVRLHKDMNDLALYIESKKKGEDYGLPSIYQVMSENSEASRAFLGDSRLQAFINKYENVIEYVHFSDQYSGEKQVDENDQKKAPEMSKKLIFCFNLGKKGSASSKDMPGTSEWTQLALYCADKCRRFKLSREARLKSDKNRQKVADGYNKLAHQQRSELAQQRREDKLKAETERYMNEEDPTKARKLEEKRQKRDQAKKMSKMKAVKIKSS